MRFYCPPSKWVRTATAEAVQAGLCPVALLAGDRGVAFVAARWRAWSKLAEIGYSYSSIGVACGFDRTTVMYACKPQLRESRIKNYYNSRTRLRAVSERS